METLEMLSKVYGESTMARSKVHEWHRHFKEGQESFEDNGCVGRPLAARNAENVALVSECVPKDRGQTLAQIAEALLEDAVLGNPFIVNSLNSGRVTTGIFCMTTHQHIDLNW
ncbi:hypothetical protein TNCV_3837341 [Trichonephila clavipes]|nr:hypothetical protein TNCV_3837341 [Trichonephila clavipes]